MPKPIRREIDHWAPIKPPRRTNNLFFEWLIPTLIIVVLLGLYIVVGLRMVPEDTQIPAATAQEDKKPVQQGHPSLDRAWEEEKKRGEDTDPIPVYRFPFWPF